MPNSSLEVTLSLSDSDLNDSGLAALTREMAAELNRRPGIEVITPEASSGPGSKGDAIAVGTILLQLLGSGGAVAVFLNGLKAYFLRKQTLVIDVIRADGSKISIHAANLSEHNLAATYSQLSAFFES